MKVLKHVKALTKKELLVISGGKYYGNGVYCTKKGCHVNWGQTWTCGVERLANDGHVHC